MQRALRVAAAGGAALVIALVFWGAPPEDRVVLSPQTNSPPSSEPSATPSNPAALSVHPGKFVPVGPRYLLPATWKAAQTEFLTRTNFAAQVQAAFAEPSAPRLAYAREAFLYCLEISSLAASAQNVESGADVMARFLQAKAGCDELTATNPSFVQFNARYKAAAGRLSEDERDFLARIDGSAAGSESTSSRLAAAAQIQDDYLVGQIGLRAATSLTPRFDGGIVPIEDRSLLLSAWLLSNCQAQGNCETSTSQAFLCVTGHCDGTYQESMAKLEGPVNMRKILERAAAINQARQSGNFSRFN